MAEELKNNEIEIREELPDFIKYANSFGVFSEFDRNHKDFKIDLLQIPESELRDFLCDLRIEKLNEILSNNSPIAFDRVRIERIENENEKTFSNIEKFVSSLNPEKDQADTYIVKTYEKMDTEKKLAEMKWIRQIPFQNGNPNEVGRNGFLIEELLEICMDRILTLNNNVSSEENLIAIHCIREAINKLNERAGNIIKDNNKITDKDLVEEDEVSIER